MTDEMTRLKQVADWFRVEGFEGLMVQTSGRRVADHVIGTQVLEIGAAEGYVTRVLASGERDVVVVEPAADYADMIEALGLPRVEVVRKLAEEFETDRRFDSIVISHVLEHVDDPGAMLRAAADLLTPTGRVIGVVPNAGSLHRRMGVLLGALGDTHDLSDSDVSIGHRRVYDVDTFQAEFQGAGLAVEHLEGHFCKPLANSQIDALPEAAQQALIDLGDELPVDLCSEILVVANRA
jgi:SAM-dependent methyltransferase